MVLGKRICYFLVVFIVFTVFSDSLAQVPLNFRNRGAQYTIGNEDELLIKVNIWGFVRMPGQYLVPSDTDLISLISYAGGPIEGAETKKVKVVRTTEFTPDGKNRNTDQKIYFYNIKEFLDSGDINLNPQLMSNDTIVLKGSTSHFITKIFGYVTLILPILQAYYWYKIASER
jgi:polysaccharide biosynthesis/export protein